MELLSHENIDVELSDLSKGWKTDDYIRIEKEFFFKDFQEALNFTNYVGAYSEEIPHHPEIIISYGHAIVTISTHDLGGLSELDFQLAQKIDRLKLDKESLEIYKNIEIAKMGNDFERRKAVGRLGNIGDIRSLPILIKSLNDKDPFVKRLSASSLGKIGNKKAVYPLATKLNQDDDGLSYAARDALINIGKPSVNELLNRIENKNAVTRRRATVALGEIGDKDSIPYLIPLLQDDDDGVRWRAARYVSIAWNNTSVELLKKLKKHDKSQKVSNEATISLKKISEDVKNLLPIFEKGIKAISEDITSKVMKNHEKQFYVNNKPFLSLFDYNPYKNRVYLFKANKKLEGVSSLKDPKWGVITFQNMKELNTVLEAAKKSYMLKKEFI
jgi:pterin-4a-carbinolamine dehydratase